MLFNQSRGNQVNLPLKTHKVSFSRKQIHNYLWEKKSFNRCLKRTLTTPAQPVLV